MPPFTQVLKYLYETQDYVGLSGLLSNVQVVYVKVHRSIDFTTPYQSISIVYVIINTAVTQ